MQNQEANNPVDTRKVEWTSTDSINQRRGKKWYVVVSLIYVLAVGLTATLFILKTTDLMMLVSSLGVITAMFVALLVSSKLPVRESNYAISASGIAINGTLHPLSEYRAFGVRQRRELCQLVIIPVKRFGVELVIYIDNDHIEEAVDILSANLPREDTPENVVDKIIERLKI